MENFRKLWSLPWNSDANSEALSITDGGSFGSSFQYSNGDCIDFGKTSVETASFYFFIMLRLLFDRKSNLFEKASEFCIISRTGIGDKLFDFFEHQAITFSDPTKQIKSDRGIWKTSSKQWICRWKIRYDVHSVRTKWYFPLDPVNQTVSWWSVPIPSPPRTNWGVKNFYLMWKSRCPTFLNHCQIQ
jgi:hypothetical protein